MATFSAKKLDLTQVNGGQEYEQGDFLQSDTINDVVEGAAYAQNVAEEANTKSNNAVSTANSANSTANAASTKVDTFDQRITTAQNTADTAVSNAATAQGTADSATTEINKIKNGTTTVPNAQHAVSADSADLATKAKQDVNGNSIVDTYATKLEVAEAQGTKVYYGSALQTSVTFDSDPQTQITANKNAIAEAQSDITANKNAIAEAQSDISDIVSGAQTVGKAKADQKGNVIDTTYATKGELGDVSKFAVPSSVTGISRDSGLWAISTGDPGGTMLLGTFYVYDTNIKLRVSGGIASFDGDTTIDVDVFISTANHIVHKAEYYVRSMYTTSSLTGLYYTLDDSHNLRVFAAIPAYGKVFVSAEVAGGTITDRGSAELQYPSGGAYLERKDYFATDPTALTPSTANGWTQIGIKSNLPSAGTYYVYPSVSGSVKAYGIATVVFDGTNNAFGATGGANILNVSYLPTASKKWSFVFANDTELTPNYILFKRIN